MALLDTTVLIDLGRNHGNPLHQRATKAVRKLVAAGETLFTSRINEAEFRVGPELANDRESELVRIERILSVFVILEFDAESAKHYARIKGILSKFGRPAGDCDTLVAAVAMACGQPLLSRNPKHFIEIPGLAVEQY